MSFMRIGVMAVTLSIVMIFMFACGADKAKTPPSTKAIEKADDKASEPKAKSDDKVNMEVNKEKNAITVTQGDNTIKMQTGDDVKLPDNFPKDVPVPASLKLVSAMCMTENSGFMVQGTTSDTTEKVTEFYQKEAAAKGWKEQLNMKQSDMQMLMYSKDEQSLNVTITKSDDKVSVAITVAKD